MQTFASGRVKWEGVSHMDSKADRGEEEHSYYARASGTLSDGSPYFAKVQLLGIKSRLIFVKRKNLLHLRT